MTEQILLGLVQGIAEWLPVSSEGALILVQKSSFFNSTESLSDLLQGALLLHVGTVLAATVYFRKEIARYIKAALSWSNAPTEDKNVVVFLVVATIVSGLIGLGVLSAIESLENISVLSPRLIVLAVGVLLLITGTLQFIKPSYSHRSNISLNLTDSILLGIVQGIATLPGLSRSGLTVAALLFRNYDKETALRLSFLMSIPIVLIGSIALSIRDASFEAVSLVGLIIAAVVGYITIDLFMRIARKVNFGYFVIGFGLLTILSAFV